MSSAIYPSIFGKVKRNQWSFMLITIIYTKYWIHRLKELGRQDDVLAGKLSFYQGCVPHEADQDGGMDGKCREIHFQNHGWQSLHIGWIQAREGQLPRKYLSTLLLSNVLNSKFSSTQCKNKSLWNVDFPIPEMHAHYSFKKGAIVICNIKKLVFGKSWIEGFLLICFE